MSSHTGKQVTCDEYKKSDFPYPPLLEKANIYMQLPVKTGRDLFEQLDRVMF